MSSAAPLPEWIDALLSDDLALLRARGEGQELEFIRSFPEQARELAKEIAAFASSNPGTILLGVSDEGDLVGLTNVETAVDRDKLIRRIEGVCRGMVKPSITPAVRFASESGAIVLVLTVPKGEQPVYYCNNVPYVRHISESRPAEPHEVIERVASNTTRADQAESRRNDYAQALLALEFPVAEVLMNADELQERRVNPWLEQLKAVFSSAADYARKASVDDYLIKNQHSDIARRFADAADKVGHFQFTLGSDSWRVFEETVEAARALAADIESTVLSQVRRDPQDTRRYLPHIRTFAREAALAAERLPEAQKSGALPELQRTISMIGANLLHAVVFPFNNLPKELRERLRVAARTLHLFETRRIFGPRVESIDDVQDDIEDAIAEILRFGDDADPVLASGGA